jgi:hypothetical protein
MQADPILHSQQEDAEKSSQPKQIAAQAKKPTVQTKMRTDSEIAHTH